MEGGNLSNTEKDEQSDKAKGITKGGNLSDKDDQSTIRGGKDPKKERKAKKTWCQ